MTDNFCKLKLHKHQVSQNIEQLVDEILLVLCVSVIKEYLLAEFRYHDSVRDLHLAEHVWLKWDNLIKIDMNHPNAVHYLKVKLNSIRTAQYFLDLIAVGGLELTSLQHAIIES